MSRLLLSPHDRGSIRGKHGSSPSSPHAENGPNNKVAYDAAYPFFYFAIYLMDSSAAIEDKAFYSGPIIYSI